MGMDNPTRWRFLLECFPETESIIMNEVLTGNNPAGDARILSAIVAAEDVVDPARAAPMGMEAILEAFAPLAPKPKPETMAVSDVELMMLKVAYADAFIAYDQTDVDDEPLWHKMHRLYVAAETALSNAARARKDGGR